MKPVPTLYHGIFDYVGGAALLAAPEIFSFTEVGGAAVAIPRILGVIVLLQSLMTDYELGVVKFLSVKAHLINDYVAGAFLAASPWIFGFVNNAPNVWVPHLVVGLTVLAISALTQPSPQYSNADKLSGKNAHAH